MRGVSHVIHLAGAVGGWAADASQFFDVNVSGTRNVVQAAAHQGVESFVHLSSSSAIDFAGSGICDERAIIPRTRNMTEYGRSKALAENEIERAARDGFSTVIVYPTRVFGIGPLDDSNAATKVIGAYLRGNVPLLPGRGVSFANWGYVNDIATGVVKALLRGRAGRRYLLGGENVRLRDVFALSRSISRRHPLTIPIPIGLGRAMASLEEFRAQLLQSRPRVTLAWYNAVFEDTRLTSARAMSEIGYTVTPFATALEKVIGWLIQGAPGADTFRRNYGS